MPPNTVNVARPSRWGNPYAVAVYGLDLALKLFRDTVHGIGPVDNAMILDDELARATYKLHCAFGERIGGHPYEVARAELRGRSVACWCAIDARCHGDILLAIANQ
jgi:hypothetical protein